MKMVAEATSNGFDLVWHKTKNNDFIGATHHNMSNSPEQANLQAAIQQEK
jgi:hypothetical protein